jgi:hypothetical protein
MCISLLGIGQCGIGATGGRVMATRALIGADRRSSGSNVREVSAGEFMQLQLSLAQPPVVISGST